MLGKTDTDIRYTYDHTGLRVKKSVNGVDTKYTLNGKTITHVQKGDTHMHIFYDAQGRPSLLRHNGTDYAYLHNLQGDVAGLVDMNGECVVEYAYDAWGKPVDVTGSLAATVGRDNPFRYRGYVFDEETGLYYLRSRYHNPEWGRFINADALMGKTGILLSHNLFAYCNNNPVNMIDSTGCTGWWAGVESQQTAEVYAINNGIPGVHVKGTGELYDILSGKTIKIAWGNIPDKNHTDWSPLTMDDTNLIKSIIHPGVAFDDTKWETQKFWDQDLEGNANDWKPRPVIFFINRRKIAAATHFVPHLSVVGDAQPGLPSIARSRGTKILVHCVI